MSADLIRAIETGNLEDVQAIIDAGGVMMINERYRRQYPLCVAAASKHENAFAIISYLLSFPTTDPNVGMDETAGLYTPIGHAIRNENPEILDLLLRNERIILNTDREDGGCYPLHMAVAAKNPEMVDIVLHHIPDVNVIYDDSDALAYALDDWSASNLDISHESIPELVYIFRKFLYNPEYILKYEGYPTLFYVPSLPYELAELFFADDIPIAIQYNYIQQDSRNNMLHKAAQSKYPDTVSMIISDGRVNMNHQNNEGNTPFMQLCLKYRTNVYHEINVLEVFLYSIHVDVNLANAEGLTPLQAVLLGFERILKGTMFVDSESVIRATALLLACRRIEKREEDLKMFENDEIKAHPIFRQMNKLRRKYKELMEDTTCGKPRKSKKATKGGARSRATKRRRTQRKH